MVKFKEIFPKYETYSGNYNWNKLDYLLIRDISRIFPDSIKTRAYNYIGRGRLDTDSCLTKLCNLVSKYASTDQTTNWGWDFLINDYYEYIDGFIGKKLHKFMDFISSAYFDIADDSSINEINEVLEEHNIGYRLVNSKEKPWIIISDYEVEAIEDALKAFQEISGQAVEHIKQVKTQLMNTENSRAIKDALRDCLSATESIIKKITGEKSYEKAGEVFRKDENTWGPKYIVADCITIWKRYHEVYPDIRHGNDDITDLTLEEAIYSIDRLLAFNMYIIRRAEATGNFGG